MACYSCRMCAPSEDVFAEAGRTLLRSEGDRPGWIAGGSGGRGGHGRRCLPVLRRPGRCARR